MDDRRVISGIIHVLRVGGRWQGCPPADGPSATICNRFNRWRHRGLWARLFAALPAQAELSDDLRIDSTPVRAHRSAHGGNGGESSGRRAVAFRLSPGNRAGISAAAALPDKLPPPARLLADKGYDANRLRARLKNSETIAVIPAA